MFNFDLSALQGSTIRLELFNETHKSELYPIAQDPTIWKYSSINGLGENFDAWFKKAIHLFENQEHLPFVVRRLKDNRLVGSTRFYHISQKHQKLTIGYTWFIPAVWGSGVNVESKYLLLSFAFEQAKMHRVEFQIDARNVHSRAAVKKLGATEEGILRQHIVLQDGFIRDTAVSSIIQSDWPTVKALLKSRIILG